MSIHIGSMPTPLREIVNRLIENTIELDPPSYLPLLNALLITSGPGGSSYLDANGVFWDWFVTDDAPCKVQNEKRELVLLLGAVENWPELASWIPKRPAHAETCKKCGGTGQNIYVPGFVFHCPECNGLGWIEIP